MQIGWEIVGAAGVPVHSMGELQRALTDAPVSLASVDFVFRVPNEVAPRRGRGSNQELASFQRRGESGGIF